MKPTGTKRLFAALIALVSVLVLLPVTAQADGNGVPCAEDDEIMLLPGNTLTLYAQWETIYPLYVGGVQVTGANKDNILEDNTNSVRFRVEDGKYILTLDNANISTYSTHDVQWWRNRTANIFFNQPNINLTVELIGDNTLSGAEGGIVFVPSDSSGVVTLTGEGSLSIDASYFGVYGFGILHIDDTTLTVGKETGENTGEALYARGIEIDGSSVHAYGKYYAIMTENPGFTITDSFVVAKGEGNGVYINGPITIGGDSALIAEGSAEEGALRVYRDVTLNDGVELIEPENAGYVSVSGGGTCVANPDGSRATRAVYAVPYNVWVGGEQVSTGSLSGEGWTYTPAEGDDPAILDLNNFRYEGEGALITVIGSDQSEYLTSAVVFYDEPEPLEIRLTGENVMHQITDTTVAQAMGIYCRSIADNALLIVGTDDTASLTATSGAGTYMSCPVVSKGELTVKDCTLNTESRESISNSYGLYAQQSIVLDGCDATLKSADVSDSSTGIISFGSTAIRNSTVKAEAGTGLESYGVCAYDWNFTANDSVLTVENSKLFAESAADAVYSYGIYANFLTVSGETEITATGSESCCGVAATNEPELSDGIAIVAPFNGVFDADATGMLVVCDADGTPAATVVLKKAATVTFVNDDGTELQSGKVALGDLPYYYGETPVKESTQQNEYVFAGWEPELAAVTGDATYQATFTEDILHPTFVGGEMVAFDSYVKEGDTILYRFDVTVETVLNGELPINSAQIFLTYDQSILTFVKCGGPVDWTVGEKDGVLFAAWASEKDVTVKDGDVLLSLYFAAEDVAPNTLVPIGFTENALGSGSAISFVDEGAVVSLFAHTQDGSILFDALLYGDANNDGAVTAADAAAILRAIVGLSVLSPRGALAADVDGDGLVTAADAAAILRFVVGLIDALPIA